MLFDEILKIHEKSKLESLLVMLLSDTERIVIAKRLVTFVLIEKGVNDTEIAKSLNLTRTTVNRLRWIYKYIKEKKEPVIETIKQVNKTNIIEDILLKIFKTENGYRRVKASKKVF